MNKTFLYVHAIWAVAEKAAVLSKPIRSVLFAHLKKNADEKGIRVLEVNGGEDHVHVLVSLHPAQNLSQVIRQLRAETSDWLNATQLLPEEFHWAEDYMAYSVSPGALKQVIQYLERQEEYHKTKTLDAELEVFDVNVEK
ncbi:IS200/IS605 family transposase [Pollutibacter soli]|uniref:IS200/IS605 family transposase n=1 Tax=Pollutibacter soli TaxID=3034157 RepID=UPI0030139780